MKKNRYFIFALILAVLGIAAFITACSDGSTVTNSEPKTFTVTFDADNGTAATTQNVTEGGKATKPTDPTKENYDFVHWFNTATNNEWDFDTVVTADLTLKAKWLGTDGDPICECDGDEDDCECDDCECESCEPSGQPKTFTVTFDADNGTATTTQNVTEGGKATKPTPDPEKANYDFVYWFNTATTTEWDFDTVVTVNLTLKAKWSLKPLVQMVYVGSGNFEMGQNRNGTSNNVTPIHTVTLTAYHIGKYEVTQKEYETVMGSGSLSSSITSAMGKGDNYPVYFVSWYEALVFCNKLSILEGLTPAYRIKNSTDPAAWGTIPTEDDDDWNDAEVVSGSTGYRLPTEAQWEYAAKGGPSASNPYKEFSGSDTVTEVARVNSAAAGTLEVGKLAQNELGLHDMSGNVFEWCWDWHGDYTSGAKSNPTGAASGTQRILRGGSYRSAGVNAQTQARSVYRLYNDPDTLSNIAGFRIARPVSAP